MNRIVVLLFLGLFLAFSACQSDETLPETDFDALPDPVNNSNDQGTVDDPLPGGTTALNLPANPFNYANPPLPDHFNTPAIRDQDNTPNNNLITNAGATLGRVLFYDKNLSVNNTIACASCHLPAHGFSDPAAFSEGFEGGLTGRNSMGLTNARYYERGAFFWDERAATLEEQTLMPIQDHIEMGMDLMELEQKLNQVDYYPALFTAAFGEPEVTTTGISEALAQFIRSMVSYESKFDEGVLALNGNLNNLGNHDFPNFTASENLGKRLFFSNRTNCQNCHNTINFVGPTPRNNGLDLVYEDNGVGAHTGNPNQNGDFKVNSLRNIELTAPYMHDGRFATLEAVIEHYDSGVQAHPNLSPQLRMGGPGGGQVRRLNLTDAEKRALVDFLKTLTDHNFIQKEQFSNPFL
ncbi:MAG: cytochrome c peroxidase [Bacteroidota bacterium]